MNADRTDRADRFDGATRAPRLRRDFFRRDPVTLAKALLGQRLVRILDGQRIAGIIVETEAYLGIEDRAAHTFNSRRTPRNESMWGDPGHAYVYFTYGMHHCMNVVAGDAGHPVAVLLRALEPTEGLDAMARHRAIATPTALCSGPGKLCKALAIDRTLDRADLVNGNDLFIECVRRRSLPLSQVVVSPRIGVAYAAEWAAKPLRFHISNNPHVSRR